MPRLGALGACLLCALGCGTSLRGVVISQSAKPPANVVAFFRVESVEEHVAPIPFLPKTVHPVPGLASDSFSVFEDGTAVSDAAQARVEPLDLGKRLNVLILVDLGGAPDEAARATIGEALTRAVAPIAGHTVGIFAFDGAPQVTQLVPVSAQPPSPDTIRTAVTKFTSRDDSTNLHGALVGGMKGLKEAVRQGPPPIQAGALILISRGPDRAARVDRSEAFAAFADEEAEGLIRYAVGVGTVDADLLDRAATADPVTVPSLDDLPEALGRVGQEVSDYGRSHYALSMCSAARAGTHEARVDVVRKLTVDGEEVVQTGSVTITFEAKQFRPGCQRTELPSDLLRR